MKIIYFYVLKDPRDMGVKYVGRSVSPKSRYRNHIFSGRKEGKKNKKESWINSLIKIKMKPIMEIIEEFTNYTCIEDIQKRETELIDEYKILFDLKNERDRTEGNYFFTEESRKKMSDSQKGNTNKRGKIISEEGRYNCGNARRGKKQSEKEKNKRYKPVLQYDMQENFLKEWESCTAAAKFFNTRQGCISLAASGKRKTHRKFIWKYKNI
jgi:hypothetical protein